MHKLKFQLLYWVVCQKKEPESVRWGRYFSKLWHAETKVGVGVLLESRSESVVSSECVCLSDSHSALRFSSMRTHTLVSSYTAPPPPPPPPPGHMLCFGFHSQVTMATLFTVAPATVQTQHSKTKREKILFPPTNKLSYLSRKRGKSTTVVLLEDKLMIFLRVLHLGTLKTRFYKLTSNSGSTKGVKMWLPEVLKLLFTSLKIIF